MMSLDPFYLSGKFLSQSSGEQDAEYKIFQLFKLLNLHQKILNKIKHIADVGCGTGRTTVLLHQSFAEMDEKFPIYVSGYDIYPDIENKEGNEFVEFCFGDFTEMAIENEYDLVVLLDVIEHVLEPVEFIKKISIKTSWTIFHIPLDDNSFSWLRLLQKDNLVHPGHLSIFDAASAINVIIGGGMKVIDFNFSPVFRAASNRQTLKQKMLFGLRNILYFISPYLLQKTLGGVSLMVLAESPLVWKADHPDHES